MYTVFSLFSAPGTNLKIDSKSAPLIGGRC